MSATYSIEYAKSARSTCKKCKAKIDKNELRIGVHNNVDDRVMTKWTHFECFSLPKQFKSTPFGEFLDEHVDDNTEGKILSDEGEKQSIVDRFNSKSSATTTDSSKVKGDNESEFLKSVKRNAAILEGDEEESDEDQPKQKKAKTMSDDEKALAEAYLKVKSMKNGELQDILSWNKVVKTGTKNVLLTRVIDGYARGRIAKCVQCGNGKPKIDDDGSAIVCTGYFDKDLHGHVPCGSRVKVESVERQVVFISYLMFSSTL